MKKRFLAIMLSILMCLSQFSIPVWAADTPDISASYSSGVLSASGTGFVCGADYVVRVVDSGTSSVTAMTQISASSSGTISVSFATGALGTISDYCVYVNELNGVLAATDTSIDAEAVPTNKTLVSITAPAAITGVANGTAKTAAGLGLPSTVTLVTDSGNVESGVTWDMAACSYDASSKNAQNFTVSGTVTLPADVVNTNSVSLTTSVSVTVKAVVSSDKILISITAPAAITGVANGTVKTAAGLGLPSKVTLVTDSGSVESGVTWDVAACSYDASSKNAQTFTVSGTVILPAGVVNTNNVSLTTSVSVTVKAATSITTYTVTFNSNGSAYATKTVNAGASIGSAAWPADPTRNSYTFGGWFTGENGIGTQFASTTPVNATMTVYAKWTYNGGSSDGGSGSSGGDGGASGGGTPTIPAEPSYNADVKAGSGSGTTLPVTVNKAAGTASIDTGSQSFNQGGTVITIPSIPNVSTYSVGIPVSNLRTPDEQGEMTFKTDNGSVTVPSNMLTGVSGISGSKAQISIGQGDKSTLPDYVKSAMGNRPLIRLTLSVDGKQTDWSNPNAPITVSIPYTPTADELKNPESIVIWYIDGSGNTVDVPNGRYNPATGMVTFDTTHFSDYAVAYNQVSFNDVAAGAWYNRAVSFIAARGITDGTGSGNYSPEVKLTRGEFLVMLMKTYGIAPDTNPADNFSDAGSTYYTNYLAAAKQLGITSGIGSNVYAPDRKITRQEMFTLLYNALKTIGQLPKGNSGKTLSHFTDAGQIEAWAKDSMTLLVKAGTVGGSNDALKPAGTTTRAEMAQVLYNLLGK